MELIKDEGGQGLIEYVLLLSLVVSFYLLVASGLNRIGLAKKLMSPITTTFAAAYQFGHPQAKGFDNGGPVYHPRAEKGEKSFRIFLNPEAK